MTNQCTATAHRTGQRCGRAAITGATVCYVHGGAAPAVKAAAARRVAEAKAAAQVTRLGARTDISPADALLDLVHWTAGEVAYWRTQVEALDREALTWGVTRIKDGGQDYGTTAEARPNVAYVMLTQSSDRLASYCVAALKAGVDERRVQLAQRQGEVTADVLRSVLAVMFELVVGTLRGEGIAQARIVDALTVAWRERVAVTVPAELRRIGGEAK